MIKIPLHRLELALKFAKKYKECKLSQMSKHVVVQGNETSDMLIFPCYTDNKKFEIYIDRELSKIIAFLKKQNISEIQIDDEGIFINNTHIKINQCEVSRIDENLYLAGDNFELITQLGRKLFDFAPFASTDPARSSINGVFVSSTGELAATNGRRLIVSQEPILAKNVSIEPVIIPITALNQLKMIFSSGDFKFYRHKTIKDLYKFSDDFIALYIIKQDDIYPDYSKCFPTEKQEIFICNGNDLYEVVMQTYKRDVFGYCSIDIEFCGTAGKIKVMADYGFNRQIDLCQMSDRTDKTVKINPLYLDFLKHKSCIKIKVIDNVKPVVIEDNDNKYVIMPMRG